jgi:hypothetical protein
LICRRSATGRYGRKRVAPLKPQSRLRAKLRGSSCSLTPLCAAPIVTQLLRHEATHLTATVRLREAQRGLRNLPLEYWLRRIFDMPSEAAKGNFKGMSETESICFREEMLRLRRGYGAQRFLLVLRRRLVGTVDYQHLHRHFLGFELQTSLRQRLMQ